MSIQLVTSNVTPSQFSIFLLVSFFTLNCCVLQLEDIQKKVENLNAGGITWEDICFR
jgi:hypothetical protein